MNRTTEIETMITALRHLELNATPNPLELARTIFGKDCNAFRMASKIQSAQRICQSVKTVPGWVLRLYPTLDSANADRLTLWIECGMNLIDKVREMPTE